MYKLIVKFIWKVKPEAKSIFWGKKGNKIGRITPCNFKKYLYKAIVTKIMWH